MDKEEIKNLIDHNINPNHMKRNQRFGAETMVLKDNQKPKDSTLWHMRHIPYQL